MSRPDGGEDPACGDIPPRLVKLVSGSKFSEDYFTTKQKEAEGYYSKEYRDYLNTVRGLIAAAPKQSEAAVNAPTQSVPPRQ